MGCRDTSSCRRGGAASSASHRRPLKLLRALASPRIPVHLGQARPIRHDGASLDVEIFIRFFFRGSLESGVCTRAISVAGFGVSAAAIDFLFVEFVFFCDESVHRVKELEGLKDCSGSTTASRADKPSAGGCSG